MKRKLLLAMVALLSIVGVRQANADTSLLTAGNGWTKITELPTDVSLYYFTIVDDSQDLMLTLSRGLKNQQQEEYNGLFYATSANPLVDKGKLFSLEKDGDNYVMRNVEYNGYFLQTEYNAAQYYRTHDNGGGTKSWGHIKFTYANSVWTIQNAKYPVDNGNYLGMWEDASPANGKALALNKADGNKGTFQIYSILKTDVDAYYASLKIANAGVTPETPVDMTGLIVNPNARFWTGSIPFGWTTTGTQNVNNGNGYDQFPGIFEFSNWGAGSWTGSLKQTITVPNGKYRLKAAVMAASGVTAYLTANSDKSDDLVPIGDSGGNINPDGTETTMGGGQRGYKYLTVETIVTTGSLELGAYGEASAVHLWVNADNFTLSYLDPSISALATEITAASPTSLTAGGWYKFTAASTDDYSFDASAVGDIIYTADDQLNSVATGTAATAVVALTGGTTYYIKSTSAQTLTITPQTFTYNVGDGTPSVANGKYTQNKTFTLTFSESSTDDPDGEFQILDASKITVNGGAATASLTDNVLTITLADAITASTDYAISVAAGAVGYKADAANTDISLTVKTPAVFDGIFFIKQNDVDKYVSRGGNDNTEAILDSYGIPVQITTDAENVSFVKFMDNNRYLYAGSTSVYSDKELAAGGNNVKWTIASYTGGYSFYNSAREKYMAAGVGAEEPNVPAAIRADAAYAWILEATSAHPAKMQAVKDAQAASAASAAGISASTQAALKTYLSENYGETAIAITGVASVADQFQKRADKGNGSKKTFITETKEHLSSGLYRLRVNAFERIAGLDAVLSAGGAPGLAYVYANDQKIQLCSLAETYKAGSAWSNGSPADISKPEGYYVNNTKSADAAFDAGFYVNDVYIYLDTDDSSIEFGIETTNSYGEANNSQWICYNNFSLVKFDAKPTAEQKTALATAISTAGGKTLGFEDGEYAPYSNIDAIEKLAEAKAINPETASRVVVVDATTALNGATWTPNDGDVECVYNGNMENVEANVPTGWTRSSNWGTRVEYGDPTKYGFYNQPGSLQYGNAGVYTMPLKAQTIYTLTFKYASQATNSNNGIKVSVLKDEEGMAEISYEENNTKYDEADAFVTKTVKFVTGTAGNYVLKITNDGNSVITDVSIAKAASQVLEFADGSVPTYAPGTYPTVKITRTLTADKWASAIYPFAVSGDADLTVATLSSFEDSQLDFSTANPSTANKPFLMKSDAGLNEISLSNVEVAAAAASPVEVGDVTFTGVYSSTPINDSAVNYVLSSNKLYKVGTAGATMNPYRAYFTVAGASLVKPLSFVVDGTATGVDSVEAAEAEEDGALYNTAGQQVTEDYKGIVIKNGKKYLNK